MLKQSKNPEGYRELLAYKKADELFSETLQITTGFSPNKTILALADQMNRSARSIKQNIVEGWKRNATSEYYTFLGYSIASNAELLEDYRDICNGRYEIIGLNGVMGERGEKGKVNGEKGKKEESDFSTPLSSSAPFFHLDIDKLKFYPLDTSLPRAVQLFLKTKELNFLLENLQKSLLVKMREEQTLSFSEKQQLVRKKSQEANQWFRERLKVEGQIMTSRGLMKLEEAEKLGLETWEAN